MNLRDTSEPEIWRRKENNRDPLLVIDDYFMKAIHLYQVILTLLTMRESFWLGLLLVMYILITHGDNLNLKDKYENEADKLRGEYQKELAQTRNELKYLQEAMESKEPEFNKPEGMPERFVQYNGHIINDYGGWYTVEIYPSRETYPKIIKNILEAQKTKDEL